MGYSTHIVQLSKKPPHCPRLKSIQYKDTKASFLYWDKKIVLKYYGCDQYYVISIESNDLKLKSEYTYLGYTEQIIRVFNIKYCNRDMAQWLEDILAHIIFTVRQEMLEGDAIRDKKYKEEGPRIIHSLDDL
jgi:hypothetical protein